MYKFIAYIPETHLDSVKAALFAAGAGRLGAYGDCCWQTLGQGQFRPLPGAQPAIGIIGELTFVAEWRVETIVPQACIRAVIEAYQSAHPYEVPAYDIYRLADPETV